MPEIKDIQVRSLEDKVKKLIEEELSGINNNYTVKCDKSGKLSSLEWSGEQKVKYIDIKIALDDSKTKDRTILWYFHEL